MEQLRAFTIAEKYNDQNVIFEVREKDMDDSICYEVFLNEKYLFTISPGGEILFISESNKMDLVAMNKLIEKIEKEI